MRLVEAIRDADEANFIVKADQPEADKRRAFAKAARETREFAKKLKQPDRSRSSSSDKGKKSTKTKKINIIIIIQPSRRCRFLCRFSGARTASASVEDEHGNRDESDIFATVVVSGSTTTIAEASRGYSCAPWSATASVARLPRRRRSNSNSAMMKTKKEEEEEEEDVGILGGGDQSGSCTTAKGGGGGDVQKSDAQPD